MSGPILEKYRPGNRAILLVGFDKWFSELNSSSDYVS